ncbi:MAG TPA: hypothetical protein VFO23_00555 [Steroidobacteraceae bacterium]|nr:hypothetical protein [Steroidobacteraceae bacterium]
MADRPLRGRLAACVLGLTPLMCCAEGLQTVTVPGGGQIVYGPLTGQANQHDAMVFMLRQVHGHYGERPQVGRFFTADAANSLAVFFTVHDTLHANQALAGMVIVAVGSGAPGRAAVLTDDPTHFGKSLNPMLARVGELMRSTGTEAHASGAAAQAPSGSIPPLHPTPFPDGSGSMSLPQGWKIVAAYSGGAVANGPRGEIVVLGRYVPLIDTSNPQAAQRVAAMTQGGSVPLPGQYAAYPYSGADPVKAFEAVATQLRRKSGQGPVTLTVKSQQPQQNGVVVRGILHTGDGEDKDSIVAIGATPPRNGNWGMMITQISVPVSLSTQEMPTLIAISKTYQANGQRIAQETQQTIGTIHAIGAAATARANAAHAQEDAQGAAFAQHMDSIDRNSAGFSNYLLDQTVVSTADNRYHGTFDNNTAAAIVESNPQKFQYVPTSGYIKGTDY